MVIFPPLIPLYASWAGNKLFVPAGPERKTRMPHCSETVLTKKHYELVKHDSKAHFDLGW